MKGQRLTGMPFTGGISDTTQDLASKRIELEKNCALVERTMMEAITTLRKSNSGNYLYDGSVQDLFDHMIKAVTNEDVTYTYLDQIMNIPVGRDAFYKIKRYFFFLLNINKK